MTDRASWPQLAPLAVLVVVGAAHVPGAAAQVWNPATDVRAELEDVRFPTEVGGTLAYTLKETDIQTAAPPTPEAVVAVRLHTPTGQVIEDAWVHIRPQDDMTGGVFTMPTRRTLGDAGPYVLQLVRTDGPTERPVAEARGWVGPPDAAILVLQGVEVDPPAPRTGQPVRTTVTVTNTGQTSGSRLFGVRVWLDDGQFTPVGTVRFEDVPAGTTQTATATWVPHEPVVAGQLDISDGPPSRGLVVRPFQIAAASAAPPAGPAADDQPPPDQDDVGEAP